MKGSRIPQDVYETLPSVLFQLMEKYEELKKKFKSTTQKPPSLKLHVKTDAEKATNEEVVSEAVAGFMKEKAKFILSKLKDFVSKIKDWGKSYDEKLDALKAKAKEI